MFLFKKMYYYRLLIFRQM